MRLLFNTVRKLLYSPRIKRRCCFAYLEFIDETKGEVIRNLGLESGSSRYTKVMRYVS